MQHFVRSKKAIFDTLYDSHLSPFEAYQTSIFNQMNDIEGLIKVAG